jgi:hypothetical protein
MFVGIDNRSVNLTWVFPEGEPIGLTPEIADFGWFED